MNREGHDVGHVAEKPMQRCAPFKHAHFATVPHAVLREQVAERVGGISGVTQVAVVGLQKPDLLGSFHSPEPGFNAHANFLLLSRHTSVRRRALIRCDDSPQLHLNRQESEEVLLLVLGHILENRHPHLGDWQVHELW